MSFIGMPDINQKPKNNDEVAKDAFTNSLCGVVLVGVIAVFALIMSIIF